MAKSAQGQKSQKGKPATSEKEKQPTTLLEAIQALGGSAEDFDLVGGDNSDFEDASNEKSINAKSDKSLEQELRGLVKELAFDQLQDRDQDFQESESEEESEDESESEEEDVETSDTVEEPAEPAVKSEAKVEAQPQPEEPKQAASTSKQAQAPTTEPIKVKAPTGPWLVAPHPVWHEIELPELPVAPSTYNLHPNRLTQLQERADELLSELNQQYAASLSPDSKTTGKSKLKDPQDYSTLSKADKSFIVTILKSGTSSDKLSALTLLASSSPLHCTSYLSQLLSLCSKRSRQEATKAVQSVVDWLKHQGLPSDRKLIWFADQPRLRDVAYLQQPKGKLPKDQKWKAGDQHLVLWAFEAWLKKWFLDVLRTLETHANDTLPFARTQMTGHFYELLSEKPEQEHNLLRLLVHKLGDLHRPLASKTSYFLLSLLQENPGMKPIVIREVAALVLRPASNLPKSRAHQDHSAYYGIITLNQILLSRHEPQVATKLIDVYFEIFTDLLARIDHAKEAADAAGKKRKKGAEKKETLEVKAEQEEEGDSKMLAAVLTGVNRAFPYADMDRDTINARLGTLFHIARTSTFNVSIQALMLIAQLSETHEGLPDRFYRALYEALLDSRLALSSKQPLFLNLLFKALKADHSFPRIAAFVKRLIQTLSSQQTPYVVGALHLLGKIFTQTPALYRMLPKPTSQPTQNPQPLEAAQREGSVELELNAAQQSVPTEASAESKVTTDGESSSAPYDAKTADPAKANAQNTYLWELTPLLHHFHPAVALHAHQLLVHDAMSTSQDLDHYTLSHFLDLFVYRDPKKAGAMRGASAMQPSAPGHDKTDRVALRKGVGVEKSEAVNNERFWNLDESEVPPEQVFFHRFFNLKNEDLPARTTKTDSRKRRRGSEDSQSDVDIADIAGRDGQEFASDFDSDDEDEIWQAMKASLPRNEGNEDAEGSDVDDDISLDLSQDEAPAQDEDEDEERPFVSAFEPEEDEKVSEEEEEADEDDDEDEEGFDFSEGSLIGSDEEMDMLLGGDESQEEFSEAARKQANKEKSNKRRKLKHLPTFATAEDYAALLGRSDDEE